eukprot:CAMPEP_0169139660 /NCGR_PEP_ID=MMETSP1015-20121227/43121_1 /TAXON_ID=342587 /ORGANISM="Karlodinium micrum, Strain CCMP2283" /LENGTH=56 /DNA_ID=CAMNT_0009205447 /DNA_START=88 /DNA_END=258 /DNA_ORIENTATION=-
MEHVSASRKRDDVLALFEWAEADAAILANARATGNTREGGSKARGDRGSLLNTLVQ